MCLPALWADSHSQGWPHDSWGATCQPQMPNPAPTLWLVAPTSSCCPWNHTSTSWGRDNTGLSYDQKEALWQCSTSLAQTVGPRGMLALQNSKETRHKMRYAHTHPKEKTQQANKTPQLRKHRPHLSTEGSLQGKPKVTRHPPGLATCTRTVR